MNLEYEKKSKWSEGMKYRWIRCLKMILDEVYVSSQNVWELVS